LRSFYITTPIYYVNDEPHIGHAYTTILADVLSRYHRLFGDEVFFSTGTDEHGLKVQEAANKRGVKPKAHCDEMVGRFIELWKKLKISYSRFIRTTERRHVFVVQSMLTYLYERGDIYFDTYRGKYCIPEERFWTEKDLKDGKCPSCGRDVIDIEEKNYFFKLSKYRDWLVDYIKQHPEFVKPETRRNEILGFLKRPLADLCISRPKSRLDWGIEIPFDKKFVTYVWFDALINYVSTIGVYRNNNTFQKWWPCDVHLVGKDIITTHAVYWPIMLKSAGFELPKSIFAHGWWLIQDAKMSKSLGNVVKPIDLVDSYGIEVFRYVLMRNMMLGSDANFSEELLVNTINSELANDYGNLLSRMLKMLQKYFDGKIPTPAEPSGRDAGIIEYGKSLPARVRESVDRMELNSALEAIIAYIRMLNKYIDERAPWNLHKKRRTQELSTVLYTALEGFRLTTVLLGPIILGKAEKALSVFSEKVIEYTAKTNTDDSLLAWGRLKPNTAVKETEVLFPRMSLEFSEIRNGEEEDMQEKKDIDRIDIGYFSKIDIRVGRILEAEGIKGSKKLIRIVLDLGNERRQIVAGIAEHYRAQELVGKEIAVLVNLKPVKIMGIESNGMLLAAVDNGNLSIITSDKEIAPGSKVR
jgi:methionyl-tRNA synthetase